MDFAIKDALYVVGLLATGVSTWIAMDRRVTKAEAKSEAQDATIEVLADTLKGLAARITATELQQGDLRGDVRVLAQRITGVEEAVRVGFSSVLSEIRNIHKVDDGPKPGRV